jgi:hypothetical protein
LTYSFEDFLKVIGIFHGDEESGIFVGINDICFLVEMCSILILWPEIPE